jgi:hypothetical protein
MMCFHEWSKWSDLKPVVVNCASIVDVSGKTVKMIQVKTCSHCNKKKVRRVKV